MLSPSSRAFEAKIAAFFKAHQLPLKAPALLGLSGGPDSTALLAGLVSLGAAPLRALHVDHGIRPAAEGLAELELVRALCRSLGVPLSLARLRPGAVLELAARSGEGIEASARRFRMAAFRRSLARFGLERLYVAHTRDDRLETILMRLLGGSGAAGLVGIRPASPPVFRPLLEIGKAEVLAYLAEKSIPFSLDSTNVDESILRNRVRGRLLPLLARHFPGWESGLELTAEKALRDEDCLARLARDLEFEELATGGLSISAEAFFAAPEAVRQRALVAAISRLPLSSSGKEGGETRAGSALRGGRVSSRLARAALSAVARGGRYRGGGMELRREGSELLLRRALDFKGRAGYFLEIDRPGEGISRLRAGRLRVAVAWVEGPGAAGLREAAFTFPLLLRSRRPGDSLALRRGSKPLDVLMSEWGIPPELRDALPILEDRAGIVAVLGTTVGGRDRYRHREDLPEGGRRLSIAVKGA